MRIEIENAYVSSFEQFCEAQSIYYKEKEIGTKYTAYTIGDLPAPYFSTLYSLFGPVIRRGAKNIIQVNTVYAANTYDLMIQVNKILMDIDAEDFVDLRYSTLTNMGELFPISHYAVIIYKQKKEIDAAHTV